MSSIITESKENYLEVIYELSTYNRAVRLTDVANHMNVSKASANKAMGVLKHAGMITQQHYGSIELTEHGKEEAEKVMKRHETIRSFFNEILGVDYELADKDACRIEHVVSEETMRLWSQYTKERLADNN